MSMAWVHYQVKLHGDSVLQDVWRKFLTDLGRSAKFRTFWRQIRRRCEATSRTQVIDKVSLVFLQTSTPSALALCTMFKSYKWTEAITVLHRCVYPWISLRIFHYLHLFTYLVYLVYLSTMFVWSQGYFMMRQHECHTLQTPNFKNYSIRIWDPIRSGLTCLMLMQLMFAFVAPGVVGGLWRRRRAHTPRPGAPSWLGRFDGSNDAWHAEASGHWARRWCSDATGDFLWIWHRDP